MYNLYKCSIRWSNWNWTPWRPLKTTSRLEQLLNIFLMIKRIKMDRFYTKNKQLMVLFTVLMLVSCGENPKTNQEDSHQEMTSETVKEAMLTAQQFNALGMEIDSLQKRNLQGYITANGRLEVPPQNEAKVTSVFGANVSKIFVIEGEQVKSGQVLAYISDPNLIQKQTDYLIAFRQ